MLVSHWDGSVKAEYECRLLRYRLGCVGARSAFRTILICKTSRFLLLLRNWSIIIYCYLSKYSKFILKRKFRDTYYRGFFHWYVTSNELQNIVKDHMMELKASNVSLACLALRKASR